MITTQINEKKLCDSNIVQFLPRRKNHIQVGSVLLDVDNYEECEKIHTDIAETKSVLLRLRLDLISFYFHGNTKKLPVKSKALDSNGYVKMDYLKYSSKGIIKFILSSSVYQNIDLKISELDDVCSQLSRLEIEIEYECCKIRIHHHNKKSRKRI